MANTNIKHAGTPAASTSGAIDIARLTPSQIADLVAKHQKNQDAMFDELETGLNGRFQECMDLLAQMKEIKPGYKAAWEIVEAPQQCSIDIKNYLLKHGGTATGADVLAALEADYTVDKLERTLTSRCAGDRPMWKYEDSTESYTLIKGKKN